MITKILDFLAQYEIATTILLAIGSTIGFLTKAIWDRWIADETLSIQTLLDKENLSSKSYERLAYETEKAWVQWKKMFRPPESGKKLNRWPKIDSAIFIRDLSFIEGYSACPTGDPSLPETPLYLRLDSKETASTIVLLKDSFERLPNNDGIPRRLLQRGEFPNGIIPKVWVAITKIIIKNREDAVQLRETVTSFIRGWIPNAHVIVEIYLAYDIVQEQFKHDRMLLVTRRKGLPSNIHRLDSAGRYALAREISSERIREGIFVGYLETPYRYSVPNHILQERLLNINSPDDLSPETWGALVISGPPGAGKTESASLISRSLVNDHHFVVINISTPKMLKEVERLPQLQSKEAAIELLIKSLQSLNENEEQMIPQVFRETNESQTAFLDALSIALLDGHPVALLVDDLHIHKGVRKSLIKFSSLAWGIKLILIERSGKIFWELSKASGTINQIHLKLWNEELARKLLFQWIPKERHQKVVGIFEDTWLSRQEQFSLYLLRTIIEFVDALENNPSDLIKKALTQHLSSVTTALEGHRPATEIVNEIQEILESPKEDTDGHLDLIKRIISQTREIDIIEMFGPLSWQSRYGESDDQNALLDAKKVVLWSQGIIKSQEEANRFLERGSDSQIFKVIAGEAIWHDTFVADGCAALYLSREIERNAPNNMIAEMVNRLDETGSIDVIKLVLGTPDLRSIIIAITKSKPELAKILDKLVTKELLLRLSDDSLFIDNFGLFLFEQAKQLPVTQISPYVRGLTKILDQSDNLKDYCEEVSKDGFNDASASKIALSVFSLNKVDNSEYFDDMKKKGANELLTVEAASLFWGINGASALLEELIWLANRGHKSEVLLSYWDNWCMRQVASDLFEFLRNILDQFWAKSEEHLLGFFPQLFGNGLYYVMRSWPRPTEQQIKPLYYAILPLARQGNNILAGEIAKWIAYYYASESNLVSKDIGWRVLQNEQIAVPIEPISSQTVEEILGFLANQKNRFYLPTIHQLKVLKDNIFRGEELVGDNLSYDRLKKSSEIEIERRHLQTWDGTKTGFLRGEIKSAKLWWRPAFKLTEV